MISTLIEFGLKKQHYNISTPSNFLTHTQKYAGFFCVSNKTVKKGVDSASVNSINVLIDPIKFKFVTLLLFFCF